MKVVVAAQDLVTAWGHGLDACWTGLLGGAPAFSEVTRFSTKAFPAHRAALVPGLEAGARESLVMQMLEPLLAPLAGALPPGTLVLLASTTGEVVLLERGCFEGGGDAGDESRLDVLLGKIQARLGVSGQGQIISAACASSSAAVAQGAALIAAGHRDSVVVVACDAVTEFVYAGFASLMALDPDGARPFDKARRGLTVGEAAGYVLLMGEDAARREGRPCLGEIAGWGLSCDANHMTGPARDGDGLARAIEQAFAVAGIGPDAIGSISAHGTGTPYNDSMEMKAFRRVMADKPVPVYSVKGSVGHTMGAAGLVEMLVALKSIEAQVVPPSANLGEVDPEAAGWVSGEAIRADGMQTVLSTNSGFGGVNAALVLRGVRVRGSLLRQGFGGQAGFRGDGIRVVVTGIGWVNGTGAGGVLKGTWSFHGDADGIPPWKDPGLFPVPVKNMGRFNPVSRMTLCACALAVRDAGVMWGDGQKRNIGLMGASEAGCLASNRAYFQDYLGGGRTLARANLFVYTLPSSPLAESAIHFGLMGPMVYMGFPGGGLADLLETAALMVSDGAADGMVAVWADEQEGMAFWVGTGEGLPIGEAALPKMISDLEQRMKGCGGV